MTASSPLTTPGNVMGAAILVMSIPWKMLPKSLMVCAHCGCKVYEGGHKEEIEGKDLMFCCHHCAHSFLREKKRIKE